MAVYQQLLESLVFAGLLDVFLPFLIVYIFLYTALINSQVLGEVIENDYEAKKRNKQYMKRIYMLVSFIITFIFVSVSSRSFTLIKIISLLVLSVILSMFTLMVLHLIRPETIINLRKSNYFMILPFSIVGIIFYIGLGLSQIIPLTNLISWIFNPGTFLFLIFAGGMYLLMKDPVSSSKSSSKPSKPAKSSGVRVPGDTVEPNVKIQDLDIPNFNRSKLSDLFEDGQGYYDPILKDQGIEQFITKDEYDKRREQAAKKNLSTTKTAGPINPKGSYDKSFPE